MSWLLISLFTAVCLWLVSKGLSHSGGIYEFPFLAGATFLGFLLPQLLGLADDPYLPAAAFEKMVFFTILCAIAMGVGWAWGAAPSVGARWSFDERRLLWVAAGLSLIGAIFSYKIDRLPPEMTEASNWTGLPVAYLFFARVKVYGFAIAALCFARRPSRFAFTIILFDMMYILQNVVFHGRRADTAEFLLIVALTAWFGWGKALPRMVAVIGIMAGTLFIHSVGDYRSLSRENQLSTSTVSEIKWMDNFLYLIENGGEEARNAIYHVNYIDKNMAFDYGIFHWNILVFNYVPAQIFGRDFKEALFIPTPPQADPYYDQMGGSTNTGMVDAFGSFWYFGAIKFFLVAYLMGRIYHSAKDNNILFELLYMLSLTPALHTITHHTQHLFSAWVHMMLFLLPLLALAKTRTPSRLSSSSDNVREVGRKVGTT
jgi:hypothetical protein